MKFSEWERSHDDKLQVIMEKLEGKSTDEVAEYFQYSNMVENEPGFCLLYEKNLKCHNIDDLNCLLCACPFFYYSDDKPLAMEGDTKIMSKCVINSKKASSYIYNGVSQCDCSDCHVPHSTKFVKSHLEKTSLTHVIEDSISFLEALRAYQLNDIFGKYKIF